jgi:hypothetical protein
MDIEIEDPVMVIRPDAEIHVTVKGTREGFRPTRDLLSFGSVWLAWSCTGRDEAQSGSDDFPRMLGGAIVPAWSECLPVWREEAAGDTPLALPVELRFPIQYLVNDAKNEVLPGYYDLQLRISARNTVFWSTSVKLQLLPGASPLRKTYALEIAVDRTTYQIGAKAEMVLTVTGFKPNKGSAMLTEVMLASARLNWVFTDTPRREGLGFSAGPPSYTAKEVKVPFEIRFPIDKSFAPVTAIKPGPERGVPVFEHGEVRPGNYDVNLELPVRETIYRSAPVHIQLTGPAKPGL